jgi:hypothetical protein
MELQNPQEIEAKVEARFRVFFVLWAGILASVGALATFGVVSGSKGTPNPALTYALVAIGVMMVGLSFLVKQNLVQKAIDKNDVDALQSAHTVTLALCESATLFGIVNHFTTGSRLSWFLFAISAAGILLNFPSRGQIRAVLYKSG